MVCFVRCWFSIFVRFASLMWHSVNIRDFLLVQKNTNRKSPQNPKVQSLLSQERVKLRTSNLVRSSEHSEGPSKQNPIKNFREKGAWVDPEAAQILGYTAQPIFSGTGKAKTSNFVYTHIRRIDRTKAH